MRTPWLAAALLAAAVAPAAAEVPQTLTFHARVADGADPVSGTHAMVFRLYDAATGGVPRWVESHPTVELDHGVVTVALGDTTPLTSAILGQQPLWVEVVLDGDTMAPRLPLRSVPFAVRAGDSERLGDRTAAQLDAAYVDAAGDHMSGTLDLGGDLAIAGRSALRGSDTWLRLNQDLTFTSGTHTPGNFNAAGLTVGALYYDPGAGNLDVAGFGFLRGGGRFNAIALGAAPFGTLGYPYETMQLDPGANLRVAFGSTERMMLTNDGRLVMSQNRGDCPNGWFCNGNFWDLSLSSILYSGLSQRSDARLKKDVASIAHGLETVRALRPVTFTWKDPSQPGTQYGFIAQEVRKVVPDLVHEGTDADHTLSIDAQEILPIVLSAVQELDARNQALERRLASATPAPGSRGDRWWLWAALGAMAALLLRRRR